VLGAQEMTCPSREFIDTILDCLGDKFFFVQSHSLVEIYLFLFARKSLRSRLRTTGTSSVATGIGNLYGNKGAVCLRIAVDQVNLTFVNAHLAAHQHKANARNRDFWRIARGLSLALPLPPEMAAARRRHARPVSGRSLRSVLSSWSVGPSTRKTKAASTTASSSRPVPGLPHGRGRTGSETSSAQGSRRSSALGKKGATRAFDSASLNSDDISDRDGGESLASSAEDEPRHAIRVVSKGQPLKLHRKSRASRRGVDDGGRSQDSDSGSDGEDTRRATRGSQRSRWRDMDSSVSEGETSEDTEDDDSRSSATMQRSSRRRQSRRDDSGDDSCSTVSYNSDDDQAAAVARPPEDMIIWFGDLNYRINGNRRIVDHLIDEDMREVMLHNDQLSRERRRGMVFPGFREAHIAFPPTYKFDVGTDRYDTSGKVRIPSWTDRILYLNRDPAHVLDIHYYNCCSDIRTSDHKPVCAYFTVGAAKPSTANAPGGGSPSGRSWHMLPRSVLNSFRRRSRGEEASPNAPISSQKPPSGRRPVPTHAEQTLSGNSGRLPVLPAATPSRSGAQRPSSSTLKHRPSSASDLAEAYLQQTERDRDVRPERPHSRGRARKDSASSDEDDPREDGDDRRRRPDHARRQQGGPAAGRAGQQAGAKRDTVQSAVCAIV
jgi:hypothetical protein